MLNIHSLVAQLVDREVLKKLTQAGKAEDETPPQALN